MDYNDTNAEEWKKHFQLEEDLARRSPEQFERYKLNIRRAYEKSDREEEGDGWLEIDWKS